MMDKQRISELSQRYEKYENERLFELILQRENYTKEAVEAAAIVLKKRNLGADLKQLMEEHYENELQKKQELEKENFNKAAAFAAELNGYFIQLQAGTTMQIKFEMALIKEEIKYYQRKSFSFYIKLINYSFNKSEDYKKADSILQKLQNEEYEHNKLADTEPLRMEKISDHIIKIVYLILIFILLFAIYTYLDSH